MRAEWTECKVTKLTKGFRSFTKLDKDVGMAILDYDDCVNKIMAILGNDDKFVKLGPEDAHDRTKSIEFNFKKYLHKLVKDNVLVIYDVCCFPTASSVWVFPNP